MRATRSILNSRSARARPAAPIAWRSAGSASRAIASPARRRRAPAQAGQSCRFDRIAAARHVGRDHGPSAGRRLDQRLRQPLAIGRQHRDMRGSVKRHVAAFAQGLDTALRLPRLDILRGRRGGIARPRRTRRMDTARTRAAAAPLIHSRPLSRSRRATMTTTAARASGNAGTRRIDPGPRIITTCSSRTAPGISTDPGRSHSGKSPGCCHAPARSGTGAPPARTSASSTSSTGTRTPGRKSRDHARHRARRAAMPP